MKRQRLRCSRPIRRRSPFMEASLCANTPDGRRGLRLARDERKMVLQVLDPLRPSSRSTPGLPGAILKKVYTDAFAEMMGGGYADAVATGTPRLSIFRWLRSNLPKGSEVLVSPITDPGTLCRRRAQWTKAPVSSTASRTATMSGLSNLRSASRRTCSAAIIVHAAGRGG